MPVLNTGLAKTSAAGFTIPYSCRFDAASSSRLSKTFAGAGNRDIWTFSAWVKRGDIDTGEVYLFSAGDGSTNDGINFNAAEQLYVFSYSGSYRYRYYTNAVYRDPSAWYHIVIAHDSTQGVAANRVRTYVNGSEITSWVVETDASQNDDTHAINNNVAHYIGSFTSNYFDGYMAEMHFIDGTQLTPSSFGEAGDYGEWKPKKVAGLTYGTNGFYLDFADSAALGNDVSGEDNDFAVTNLTAADQMLDSPTNSFCTWNPLDFELSGDEATLSEGNLKLVNGGSDLQRGTLGVSSGKWYVEFCLLVDVVPSYPMQFGIGSVDSPMNHSGLKRCAIAYSDSQNAHAILNFNEAGSSTEVNMDQMGDVDALDIIQMAFDVDTGKVWLAQNNTWANSGNPAGDASPAVTLSGTDQAITVIAEHAGTAYTVVLNCGQDSSFAGAKTAQGNQDGNSIGDFYYTPPTGFLALCTSNLPAVAVTPSEHFDVALYTGNGSTQNITSLEFQPDFTWIKNRTAADSNQLFDAVRGVTVALHSDTTAAEAVNDDTLTHFLSNGFTTGDDVVTNTDEENYVAWNWKGGGSAVSNGDGNVTTSVSANTDAGFSIVTWTGDGSGPNTYGHGLDLAPQFVTAKRRNDTSSWYTWFEGITSNYAIFLNDTNAQQNDGNLTAVSATTITAADGIMCDSGVTFVAYCFHSVDGYSKVGSYKGNNAADGTFIYLGFRPKYFIIKASSTTDSWLIYDSARDTINDGDADLRLHADNDPGDSETGKLDFLSNGVKIRIAGTAMNEVHTYIYLAFAETPFKYSNAR